MRRKIKVIVNFITLSRLVLTIVLMCFYRKIPDYLFLIFIGCLYATDFIDGKLARKYSVETFFGSNMDALADKFLNISLILPLIKITNLYYFLLGGEILILVINFIGKITGKNVKVLAFGKVKMWFMFVTVLMGYITIFNNLRVWIVNICLIITLVMELGVIISYIYYLVTQKEKKYLGIKMRNDLKYVLFDSEYYHQNK